ncbi:Aste57867_12559 [Aphanomyces stellatus]|uniref:Aste57867_12559 protein n=1 Tax=Aphanomyces stellatus TaxID=120398 RepID=A0A485KX98_9STRA|nr:hypothetical protein As57867_012513 [Aphanomyces stellatus]VFT89410.1 Aste57867_12559 [Aphanomyces stellatus]
MRSVFYLFALLATSAATAAASVDPTFCPYTNWTAKAIQTYNKNTAEFEIVDHDCKVLSNTTTFQAVGDVMAYPGQRLEYKDMPELIDVEHAFWPTTMTSMRLQNIGATTLSSLTRGWINWRTQTVYQKTFERLELVDMSIDALPAELPKFKMAIIATNVSIANRASIVATQPVWMELDAVKNVDFQDAAFDKLRYMSISNAKIKTLSNVTMKDLVAWHFNHVVIDSMANIQVQPLQIFWIANTTISNWILNASTYQALESMPKTTWGPMSGGFGYSQGWMVNNTSFQFEKSVCDKQGGVIMSLWSQPTLQVCVLNLPCNGGGSAANVGASAESSTSNTGTVVAVSAACVALLVAVLVAWHRKKASAAKKAQPVLTAKTID